MAAPVKELFQVKKKFKWVGCLFLAEAVQCYVCSWSPTDTNRADICTRANFSDTVRTHTCDLGCESVSVFDKNGQC